MCFKEFALRRQCAIHQCSIFQQGVEHGYECALVIVPSKTELLIIIHCVVSCFIFAGSESGEKVGKAYAKISREKSVLFFFNVECYAK